jgi:hypothetical protein
MVLLTDLESSIREVVKEPELPPEPEPVVEEETFDTPVWGLDEVVPDEEGSVLPDPLLGGPNTPVGELETGLTRPDGYVAILIENEVLTAQDIMDVESDHEEGIAQFRRIGPKVRDEFVGAAKKAIREGRAQ